MNNGDINYEKIEDVALDVIEQYGIQKPVVNAFDIAKKSGIQVLEVDMSESYPDVAGFYNEKEKTIYVAKDDVPQRKLFTVAHELGHVFLRHPNYSVLYRLPKEDGEHSLEERAANAFAAKLLMPDYMLRDYLEKYNLSRGAYREMAKIFGVPMTAMKYTLQYLKG